MTNAEVLDIMMGRLGKRTAPTLRITCLQELNLAIRELERGDVKPWFLEELSEGAFVANQSYITLPTDFLEETEEGTFEVVNSEGKWTELLKVSREKLREETANEAAALPEGYAIWGNKFLLGPKPDSAYSYQFDYYSRTDAIVDSNQAVSNDWLNEFFDYTTTAALIKVAGQHIQSMEMLTKFKAEQSRYYDQFLKAVNSRQQAGRTYLLTNEES